ncbi:LysR family transcriptional regulator [Saccharibacillus sp. CPCC 101409]|uniref:LysR family transcriptional regulator n=1 Tax=Saccharibacillus sp. CPCC 101409 TaxID=3058041 RepID=UPI00267374AD|nr:LysR family transcriptional regulator [Saccharibacillus sp. CPCC 101409]MDO3411996.1 LysR family transcriptional regulator [Saccharibacillus sp. CPCC 101409]
MNIENIESFVYINHYGSFNKTAEALFLSQPSVTARIQTLERELGCRLFDRIGKQVVLTEEGRKFLPYAQEMLKTLQKGRQHIRRSEKLPQELRIGSTISVSNYLIPELLPRLQERYPGLHVKLSTGGTDEVVRRLLAGEIDLGFIRKVMHPSLKTAAFYEDPIHLYVRADHPFAQEESVSIEELQDRRLVFFECGTLDWLRIHRAFEALDSPPEIAFHVDNSETAKKLVLGGAGIGFLPAVCVRDEVRSGRLLPVRVRELAEFTLQTSLVALRQDDSQVTQHLAEVFGELVREREFALSPLETKIGEERVAEKLVTEKYIRLARAASR